MFHYMHLVFFLVLLHIKQLPKLFELMEFTESLKNHQHCDKAQQQITWVQKKKKKRKGKTPHILIISILSGAGRVLTL